MPAALTTVIIGAFGEERREVMRQAALRAKAEPTFYIDALEARRGMREPQHAAPRCMFIDGATPGLESFVAWVRGEARLFSVPVVVLTAAAADQAYRDAHAWGADDVQAAADLGGITRRLANLSEFDPAVRPPITQGRAVIAHENESRRRVLGRILRQGGFDVSFAADRDELAHVSQLGTRPSLLVCAELLGAEGAHSAVEKTRRVLGVPNLPAVVLAKGDPRALAQGLAALGATGVTSETAPADNLLFIANELLRPDVHNLRASARLLFSSICAFRRAGVFEPVHGLTYNISREGLYIRTLDLPTRGTLLWFEMRPPHGTAAVHLRANVVWCRGLNSPGGAAPSGFGVRLQEDACPPGDLAAYREAYDAVRSTRFAD